MPATAPAAYRDDEVTAVHQTEQPMPPARRILPPPHRREPEGREPERREPERREAERSSAPVPAPPYYEPSPPRYPQQPYADSYAEPYQPSAAPSSQASYAPSPETFYTSRPEPSYAPRPEPSYAPRLDASRNAPSSAPRPASSPPPPASSESPTQADVVAALSLVRRFAIQADLAAACRILAQGVEEVLGCDRVYCLTKDPLTGEPWALASADNSVAALAARQVNQVAAQPLSSCPVFSPEVDDPRGSGADNGFAQPIIAGGGVVAVLLAIRAPHRALFAGRESALLMMLAEQCGPLLLHAVHTQAQREAAAPKSGGLFRGQALETYRSTKKDGALLSLSPSWIRVVYPAVLFALAVAFGYGVFAKVDQYSTGPAVIKIEGAQVTARSPGTVEETFVNPGQRVAEGDLLVQLHSEAEDAELSEIEKEYEQQMASFLFDPANDQARTALAQIKARKLKADKMRETRSVRAPRGGIVSDIRVTPGSRLEAGEYILTIAEKDAMPTIIAFLPGADRPRLRRGMTIQLKLPGYEKAHELATISEVGREVIGPRAAAAYVGEKIADALPLKGSVVIVRAQLGSRTFTARDKTYAYHDGMTARAEASVQSRRVLVALVPALEKWL